ncbi:hypothetical protein TMO_a0422 (plasmid) [Tistrella mobilis KA081020-065]|uniref:Uncharacterized protein n=1 Tax=Tistrella mobilis (strain KA081020-065) TaxID=1110502 RepID=I3TST7_TISMK|nr:hypothetical protein TMO_a0422 [Tistrella mobilis KA081020-065]
MTEKDRSACVADRSPLYWSEMMQMNAKPVTTAASVRGVWSRPELEVLSIDETAIGAGVVNDGSGQS